MADDHCVPISVYSGPGCQSNEPMALVAMCAGACRRSLEGVPTEADHPQEGTTPFESDTGKCREKLLISILTRSSVLPEFIINVAQIGVKKPAYRTNLW